jgi:flavin reductase (DIM6/NTAB) family NADH-FMN oxidoreductase RutF
MTEATPHPLSWFWTPLVVVTAAHAGARSGQIAVSAHGASILPNHPRLTVALWKTNYTRDLVDWSGRFALHLLREDQDELVYHFGLQSGRTVDKFAGIEHETGGDGLPLLHGCLAAFICRVVARLDGGDHTLFLAAAREVLQRRDGSPLWWRDLQARMPEEQRRRWQQKSAEDMHTAARRLGVPAP